MQASNLHRAAIARSPEARRCSRLPKLSLVLHGPGLVARRRQDVDEWLHDHVRLVRIARHVLHRRTCTALPMPCMASLIDCCLTCTI